MPSDHDARTDEVLIRSFVAGDREAFTELMARHEDRAFAIAYRITGDRSDAMDAAQDAFVTVYTRAHSFRGESAFSTWLYRITVNSAHDIVRKKVRTTPVEDPEAAAGGSIVATSNDPGRRIDVVRALATLGAEYREAVVLHDLGGVPYEEIAAITGVALGTVKSRISRGRRLLAAALEPEAPSPTSKGRP